MDSSAKKILRLYMNWVGSDPTRVDTVELSVSMLSCLLAGKFSKDILPSEISVSLRRLIELFHDQLLFSNKEARTKSFKLRCWLTILEHTEKVLELVAKYAGGERGRWSVITCLQTLKFGGRLLLIFYYKDKLITDPHVSRLRKIKSQVYDDPNDFFLLERTGILVRKVSAVPPHKQRIFQVALSNLPTDRMWNRHVLAEVLYIVKPIIELQSMYIFGGEKWKSWLTSLIIDLTSLYLHNMRRKPGERPYLTPYQHEQVNSRFYNLLLYAMRTPFYERHTRRRLHVFLDLIWKLMPFSPTLVKTYFDQWQSIYFNVRPG